MSDFLAKIKTSVQARAESISVKNNLKHNDLDFCQIFTDSNDPVIIAEIKFASPSRGRIYHGPLEPTEVAKEYLSNGASALSILAEPDYFSGNIEYISDVRKTLPQANILLKDFILTKAQIAQALEYGANAVLLIVAFLNKQALIELHEYALNLGLTPIIEIHDLLELQIALELRPRVIGINNRNLKTLKIDLNTSRELIKFIPKHIYAICESGIQNKAEIEEMQRLGFSGFLIGSHFMEKESPGKALGDMLLGGKDAC